VDLLSDSSKMLLTRFFTNAQRNNGEGRERTGTAEELCL
jgi:hypothetical protein